MAAEKLVANAENEVKKRKALILEADGKEYHMKRATPVPYPFPLQFPMPSLPTLPSLPPLPAIPSMSLPIAFTLPSLPTSLPSISGLSSLSLLSLSLPLSSSTPKGVPHGDLFEVEPPMPVPDTETLAPPGLSPVPTLAPTIVPSPVPGIELLPVPTLVPTGQSVPVVVPVPVVPSIYGPPLSSCTPFHSILGNEVDSC